MSRAKKLCNWLEGEIGKPYIWGDKDGNPGWDCSGLAKGAYKHVGITIPDGSYNQIKAGRRIDPKDAYAGCLIFKWWPITKKVHHVAIVVQNGAIIEARGKKWGVIKRTYNPKEWHAAVIIDELYAD